MTSEKFWGDNLVGITKTQCLELIIERGGIDLNELINWMQRAGDEAM
jgi:hypothetical protein